MIRKKIRRIILVAGIVCSSVALMTGHVLGDSFDVGCGATVDYIVVDPPDWTQAERDAIQDAIEQAYPNVTVIGEATKIWNCHKYVWAYIYECWVNDPGPYIYTHVYDALNGDKLTYGSCLTQSPEHSAWDLPESNYKARSKWGALCTVEHDWDDAPYSDVVGIYGIDYSCSSNDGCIYSGGGGC